MFAPRVSSTGAKLLFAASAALLVVVYLCLRLFSAESALRERQTRQQAGPPAGVEAQKSGGASHALDEAARGASAGRDDRERRPPHNDVQANAQGPLPATHAERGASPGQAQDATPPIRDATPPQALDPSRPDAARSADSAARSTPTGASQSALPPSPQPERRTGAPEGVGSLPPSNGSATGQGRPSRPLGGAPPRQEQDFPPPAIRSDASSSRALDRSRPDEERAANGAEPRRGALWASRPGLRTLVLRRGSEACPP
jgi:hypothetical protein